VEEVKMRVMLLIVDSILNKDEKYRDLVNGREEYIIDKCCSKKKEKFTLYTDINRNINRDINNDISHNINLIIIIIILVFSIFFLNQMR